MLGSPKAGEDIRHSVAQSPKLASAFPQAVPPAGAKQASAEAGDSLQRMPGLSLAQGVEIPSLPEEKHGFGIGGLVSLLTFVGLPLALAILYFGFIAAPQYATEFRFTVRNAESGGASADAPGAIASLLGGSSSQNVSESYIVTDYMMSRQAVEDLESVVDLRAIYSRPTADWWARFDPTLSTDRLATYWHRMVSASYDQITGVATARVRAFSAEDAYTIARSLLQNSEAMINKTINRPIWDAVMFAERDVERAEQRLKTIRADLAKFRTTERVIEPNSSVVTSNVSVAAALRMTISQMEAELSALALRKLPDTAPVVQSLRSRIAATRKELAAVEAQLGSDSKGKSLTAIVGEFEVLDLEKQFAQNVVVAARQTLEKARATALAQHIYVTAFVGPNKAVISSYPRTYLSIALTALYAFMIWTIGLLVVRAIREHIS
jgi:capsular polysaccharide transport system permease protein